MEAALDALHQSNPRRLPLSLELAARDGQVGLYCCVPTPLKAVAFEELRDAYPGSTVSVLRDSALDPPLGGQTVSVLLHLTPDVFPIKTFPAFEDNLDRVLVDPLAGLLSALRTNRSGKLSARVILHIRPASDRHVRRSRKLALRLQRSFPLAMLEAWHRRWSTHPRLCKRSIASLLAWLSRRADSGVSDALKKLDRHLFEVHVQILVAGPIELRHRVRDKLVEISGAFGRFTSGRAWFSAWRLRRGSGRPRGRGFLMSAEELATLWHPPVSSVQVERMQRSLFREMEPPFDLPSKETEHDVTALGRVRYRQRRSVFGIRSDDLRRHLFLCGRTGTGKSTLIRSMVLDSICAGRNVCVIDPHGDLVDSIMDSVPKPRTNDVVLFSAADREFPVAFNPLHCPRLEVRPLVADGVVSSFKKLYGDSWGPRLEQILRNAVLALLEQKEPTLLHIQRLLTSRPYRTTTIGRVSDPVVRTFWLGTFGAWNDRFQAEAVSPVLNKLDAFLANPIARAITCQRRTTIDVREILDNPRAILL